MLAGVIEYTSANVVIWYVTKTIYTSDRSVQEDWIKQNERWGKREALAITPNLKEIVRDHRNAAILLSLLNRRGEARVEELLADVVPYMSRNTFYKHLEDLQSEGVIGRSKSNKHEIYLKNSYVGFFIMDFPLTREWAKDPTIPKSYKLYFIKSSISGDIAYTNLLVLWMLKDGLKGRKVKPKPLLDTVASLISALKEVKSLALEAVQLLEQGEPEEPLIKRSGGAKTDYVEE